MPLCNKKRTSTEIGCVLSKYLTDEKRPMQFVITKHYSPKKNSCAKTDVIISSKIVKQNKIHHAKIIHNRVVVDGNNKLTEKNKRSRRTLYFPN